MKWISSTLILLALTALPLAADPVPVVPVVKLPPEVSAKPGRLIRLQAETDCKVVKWFVNDPDNADLIPITFEKAAIFSAVTPGKYRVYAYTAAGDVPSEPAIVVVAVAGPSPPPGPGPSPGPTPSSGKLWFIAVDDVSTRTAATGKLLGNVTFWKGVLSKQVEWEFYQQDSQTVKKNGYDRLGYKVPYYLILDEQGNPVKHGNLPADENAVLAILKELGR